MTAPRFRLAALAAGALLALAPAAPARAQGAGTTGASVLQLPAGSRAPSFSGGYAAATGDVDVIFYNPAGLSSFNAGAAVAFEPLVEGMSFGSGAGSFRIGSLALGAGIAYLNGGTVQEITPDPLFGGQRGTNASGQTVSASESAARFAAALPLLRGRLRVGAAAGFVSTSLAGTSSGAALFDLGAQAGVVPSLTVGAAVRNLGSSLGQDSTAAPLPAEARVGLSYAHALPSGLGLTLSADFVSALKEHTSGVVGGVEAGFLPTSSRRFGAVARVGYSGAQGGDGLAPLQVGGGLTLGAFALDYTFQNLKYLGAEHRLGLRWLSPLR